jgi:adenosylcobinamide-GDP ribazoletransferase
VVGLILALLLKAMALSSLSLTSGLAIILAAGVARWCILLAALLPQARTSGMGADFAAGFQRSFLFWSAIIPIGLAIFTGVRGLFSIVTAVGATALMLRLAKSRIGGVTGDVFGMIVEISEVAILLVFLIGS